jgi:hypothetical protein
LESHGIRQSVGRTGTCAYLEQHLAARINHNHAARKTRGHINRLVGILHGCLAHHTTYDEHTAWDRNHEITRAA